MHVSDISLVGRASQGVRLIKLKDDETISNVAISTRSDDEEVVEVSNESYRNNNRN